MARKYLTAILLLAVLLCACSSKDKDFYRPYSGNPSDTRSPVADKEARLGAYSDDVVVIRDNEYYPVQDIEAPVALGFRVSDGEIVLCKNGYDTFMPGNLTKMFVAYYVLTNYDIYKDVKVASDIFSIDSSLWAARFTRNDELRLKDLIYGGLLYCANDVFIPISDATTGSLNSLAVATNDMLRGMGAENTSLMNCYGVASAGMQTNIYDTLMFLKTALKNDDILKIMCSASYSCEYSNGGVNMSVKWKNALPYFSQEGYETASGLRVVGGICEDASLEPTQMLVIARDDEGELYAAFTAGASSYDACKRSIEEILQQISKL